MLLAVGLGLGVGIGFVAADALSAPEGVPHLVTYEGYLTQNGSPIADGPHDMWFRMFTTASGGSPVWQLSQRSVTTSGGHFTVTLGDTTDGQPALLPAAFSGGDMWLEVAVSAATEIVGRQRVVSVPYALRAANGVPSGSLQAYAGTTVPTGWLLCDGSAVRRADYPSLFQAIGTTWGDGTTTTISGGQTSASNHFNLPDLRGRFVRGVDGDGATIPTGPVAHDPDRDTRVATAAGSQVGNRVGTLQDSAFKLHTHAVFTGFNANANGGCGFQGMLNGAGIYSTLPDACSGHPIEEVGDDETRPVNVAALYIIKY